MVNNYFYQAIGEQTSVGYSYNKVLYNSLGEPTDYQYLQVNEAYELMLGIQKKDWIGKTVSELYQSLNTDSVDWQAFHQNFLREFKGEEFEKTYTHLGKYYRVKIHSPKKDYILTSLTDISKEQEKTEQLQILFDSVPIQVWYLKDKQTYLSANQAHADFIGIKSEEFLNGSIRNLLGKEEAEPYILDNEKVFNTKKEVINEEWMENSDGSKRLLKITKSPKFDAQDRLQFVICSAEDITEDYQIKKENEIQERILKSSIDFTKELLTNDDLSEALSTGLEMIGNATKVDRVYYWENHYEEESDQWMTSQKIEWRLDNVKPQMNNPERQNIPLKESVDFIGVLAQNKPFASHIKDMKDGKNKTRQILEDQGILSTLVIPVFIKGEFEGFVGLNSCKVHKEWSEIEISLLKSFVFLYVKALEQNQLQKEVLQVTDNFFNFFNMIEDLLVVLSPDGKILDINNNVLDRLNYSREELLGESYLIFHPKNEREMAQSNFEDILRGRKARFNISAITKDGNIFPVETTNSQGLWDGKPAVFGVVKDVSDLALSEDKFSKAFNNSGVSMFISRFANGEILEVNDTFLKYVGYREDEVLGKTTLDLKMTKDYENRDRFIEQIETKGKITDLEINFISKDKIVRTGLTNIVPIKINGESCLLSSIVDISDRIENEKKILELSYRDVLTNLYNRRFIYESVEEIIADYKENDELFSVAILDIDNFKEINDQYGHQIGDCILVEFSNIINENLREYDVLGRYGGEEFIVLLNHADLEEANGVLKRILDIVRNNIFTCAGQQIKFTFSAGLTSCEEVEKESISLDQLIGISDKKMYLAKKNGKNRIVY